jgi:transposase
MAAVVYQTNKKTGVTYAYESVSYWDKQKHQSRARRKCIGRVDPATREIVPTRKIDAARAGVRRRPGPVAFSLAARRFFGTTYLLDCIGKMTGLTDDLKACFPDRYKQLLSIAYYLVLEGRSPLSRFPHWAGLHHHPHGEVIPSQRSSELFASITEDERRHFFRVLGKRRVEKEYLAYDSTSVSSYSKCLRQVRYGKNKDHEHLPQINLSLLFGQCSHLPFYYRKMAGNIPDVMTLRRLIADMNAMGFEKIKVVLDRGFFSTANINELYRHHMKFLIAGKVSMKLVRTHLDRIQTKMRNWSNYSQAYRIYSCSVPTRWGYVQERPYKGDSIEAERRLYLHLYFSPEQALEDEQEFNNDLSQWQEELLSGNRNPDHEKHYAQYFEVTTTPVRGTKVVAREQALADTKRHYGYFALLSNDIKDAVLALETYRNKDMVEKAFENLKERLNLRRVAVSSERSLDGKLFVQFIALFYVSYITKKMQENNLFKDYTLQELLDELDIIECFEVPGNKIQIGETTRKQLDLYDKLGMNPPTSLQ